MIRLFATAFLALLLAAAPASAQQTTTAPADVVDTSYRPSPSLSARLQRQFLSDIRWSAGAQIRDELAAAFAETPPVQMWEGLVAEAGLAGGNVVDALTAYWVLNWITANGAYGTEIDHQAVRRQLLIAFANDAAFRGSTDQQRQELAEGYVFNFLVQHAQLNYAVAQRDTALLTQLAQAAIVRFRQNMNVDLRGLVPGPNGFEPRPAN